MKPTPERRPKAPRKQAVLVLGAPRSGTSAVSHLLSAMGVYFGEESAFVDASREQHNPIFFELQRLNGLNDSILGAIGHRFGAFDYFPGVKDFRRLDPSLSEAATDLIRTELKGAAFLGMKDPRFCFTLPFWRGRLKKLGYDTRYVLATRAQSAIVQSNMQVNGESESYNHRLVWASLGAAATHLEGEDFITVDYDAMVDAPEVVARRVAKWLGISKVTAINRAARVIRADLRKQVSKRTTRDAAPFDVDEFRSQYLDLRSSLEASGIIALLDQRREQLAILEAKTRDQAARVANLEHENSQLTAALEQRDPLAASILPLAERIDWHSRALVEFGDHLREQVETNRRAQEQLHGEIARLNALNADILRAAQATEERLRADVARLEAEVATAHEALASRDAEHAKALFESADRYAGSEEARQSLQDELGKVQANLATASGLEHELQVMNGRLAAAEMDGEQLRAQLADRDAALQELEKARDTFEAASKRVSELERELQIVQGRVAAAEADGEKLRGELAALDARRKELASALEVAQASIHAGDKDRQALETRLAAAREEISGLEMRNGQLMDDIDNVKSRMVSLHDERRVLDAQLVAVKGEAATLQARNQELAGTFEAAQSRIADLDGEILDLRSGFEDQRRILVARSDASESARRHAERRAVRLLEQLRHLSEQHETAMTALAATRAELERMAPPPRLLGWVSRRLRGKA